MKAKEFIRKLDEELVVAAIAAAEKKCSGEIRVFVSQRALKGDDLMARAAARFQKLGMTATRERNGVLLYFMPRERKFVVIGDTGIHEKCGPDFWTQISDGIEAGLKAEDFTGTVVRAVSKVGVVLEKHFPPRDGDQNELPDGIVSDADSAAVIFRIGKGLTMAWLGVVALNIFTLLGLAFIKGAALYFMVLFIVASKVLNLLMFALLGGALLFSIFGQSRYVVPRSDLIRLAFMILILVALFILEKSLGWPALGIAGL